MKVFLLPIAILQLYFMLSIASQTTINFLELSSIDAENAFSITSNKSDTLIVFSTDINGDSINDLFIAKKGYSDYAVRVYVLYGGEESFGNIQMSTLEYSYGSRRGIFIYLDGLYQGALWSIDSFGDFNNDGINDVIIQVISTTFGSTLLKGIMIYGKDRNPGYSIYAYSLTYTEEAFTLTVVTPTESQTTAFSAIRTGDINNDGIDDGLIRIQQLQMTETNSNEATNNGIIYALYGNPDMPRNTTINQASSRFSSLYSKLRIYDKDWNEMLPIEWIGDINHDGVDDFAGRSSTDGGDLYVIYGRKGGLSDINVTHISDTQGFRIKGGRPPNDASNYYYIHAGDLNGDGIDDFLVGTEQNVTLKSVYIIYGKVSGFSEIDLDSFTSIDGFKIIESAGKEILGRNSRYVGDVNKDGFDDLLVFSQGYSTGFNKVYLIFGQKDRRPDIDVTAAETLLDFEAGVSSSDAFYPIKAGDLNGDGVGDIVLAAKNIIYGLYGDNCEAYTDCLSPMPTICYASRGCACRKKGMMMQDLSCVSSCSPGYYQAPDSTCKICSVDCKECSNNSVCKTCFDGYLPQDSLCVSSCFGGYLLQDSLCVASCSDGYLPVGSICRSIRFIVEATVGGAIALVVIVFMVIVYLTRRKRVSDEIKKNQATFSSVKLDSETPLGVSTIPAHERKDSYLEQPIEYIHNHDDLPPRDAMREEDKEDNKEVEEIEMPDQKKAEYEVQVKRIDQEHLRKNFES